MEVFLVFLFPFFPPFSHYLPFFHSLAPSLLWSFHCLSIYILHNFWEVYPCAQTMSQHISCCLTSKHRARGNRRQSTMACCCVSRLSLMLACVRVCACVSACILVSVYALLCVPLYALASVLLAIYLYVCVCVRMRAHFFSLHMSLESYI